MPPISAAFRYGLTACVVSGGLSVFPACTSSNTAQPEAAHPLDAAPGTGGPEDPSRADAGSDGASSQLPAVARCAPACPSDEVCSDGVCTALPPTCPCPIESYCDLALDKCKVGCTEDAQCSKGRYCDTAARECKAGCRSAADCASPAHGTAGCRSHSCTFSCGTKFHRCGEACSDDRALTSCGTSSCTPCPDRANAASSCDGTACGFVCAPGFVDCNGDASDGCERPASPILCYRDADGDGYGAQLETATFQCGVCPVGYTAKADVFDCYDGNKDVFPGQTQMFGTPYDGNKFAYDCDGSIQMEEGQYSKTSGPCFIEFPASMRCGETRELYICRPNSVESFTRRCR